MGTGEFAIPSLEQLIARNFDILGVVTQPDRPSGRGKRLNPPPVKIFASEHDLSVYQPEKVRHRDFIRFFKKTSTNSHRSCRIRPISAQIRVSYPTLWMHQRPSVSTSEISRSCANSMGINQW